MRAAGTGFFGGVGSDRSYFSRTKDVLFKTQLELMDMTGKAVFVTGAR
jgi:hypothetical protein